MAAITGSVTNKYAREYGTTIFAFTGAKIDINKRFEEDIKGERGPRNIN